MAFRKDGNNHSLIAGEAMSSTDFRFVKLATTAMSCVVAGNGERTSGIRQNSPAISEPLNVATDGAIAKLTLGSGGATVGAQLGSDAAGAGIIVTANNAWVGAEALEAGNEGDVISVIVRALYIGA